MNRAWVYGPQPHGIESWIGPLFMIIFLAVLVVGIILIVRALTSRRSDSVPPSAGTIVPGYPPPTAPNATALRILEERYARGEMDRDEFFQRRHDLYAVSPAPVPTPVVPTGAARPADLASDPQQPQPQPPQSTGA